MRLLSWFGKAPVLYVDMRRVLREVRAQELRETDINSERCMARVRRRMMEGTGCTAPPWFGPSRQSRRPQFSLLDGGEAGSSSGPASRASGAPSPFYAFLAVPEGVAEPPEQHQPDSTRLHRCRRHGM